MPHQQLSLSSRSGGGRCGSPLYRLSWVKTRESQLIFLFSLFSPSPDSPVPHGQPTHRAIKNHTSWVPTAPYQAACLHLRGPGGWPCSKQGSPGWLPGDPSPGCAAGPAVEGACGSRSTRPAALVSVLPPPTTPASLLPETSHTSILLGV